MKLTRRVCYFVAAGLLAGIGGLILWHCSSLSVDYEHRLTCGMTRAEVIRILGREPDTQESIPYGDETEIFAKWIVRDGAINVTFDLNGIVDARGADRSAPFLETLQQALFFGHVIVDVRNW